MIDGKPMPGMWYARTEESEARRQVVRKASRRGTEPEEVDRGEQSMQPAETIKL